MKHIFSFLFTCVFSLLLLVSCADIKDKIKIDTEYINGSVEIVHKGHASTILTGVDDARVVSIAANALANDIELISGVKPKTITELPDDETSIIIAGTVGSSCWVDGLIANGKLDVSNIKDKWETFFITVVNDPYPGIDNALVIVGSDRRGTAYGIFEFSGIMGVSPLVWWADVKPEEIKELYVLPGSQTEGPPSVKYRGIFLNDEDWGLQPWAASKMDTTIKDIGPNTYAHIFELLLRMKANFIWPAMHPCTKAFYYYPENPQVADDYAIVVGSSHCEPLLRNNVDEWKNNFVQEYGEETKEWRYDLNKDQIYRYWDDRVKQAENYESFYTIGMRGIHDGRMPGPKDQGKKIKLLEEVIVDQRQIISNHIDEADKVPQLFCPYKEVLSLYQAGLDLPEDITIVWADDNHGYIRQLSTPDEQKRSGGSGVYYHMSYWGAPHDYLWLSTISPMLISYEMTKAYQFGADKLWVFNVGDIKPNELEMQFALDMAWDVEKWNPEDAIEYLEEWAEKTFGEKHDKDIAELKKEFYRLTQNGKPEHMRMLKFTPVQAAERLSDYKKLLAKSEKLAKKMPKRLEDAYFQLIHYPIEGATLMNEKVLYAQESWELAKRGKNKALKEAEKAIDAYQRIIKITEKYNKEIANGKWDGIMSFRPRGLPVFDMPLLPVQANVDNSKSIPDFDYSKQKYLSDVPAAWSTDKTIRLDSFLIVPADDYSYAEEADREEIISIEGLGIGGRSISRFPFTGKSFGKDEVEKAPFVDYDLELEPGKYKLKVLCLPTQRIHKGRSIQYGVSVDGGDTELINVDVSRRKSIWIPAVLRGYSQGESLFDIEQSLQTSIRIYIMDTGMAISRLELTLLEE